MRTVGIMCPSVLDIGCISHALHSVGEKLGTLNLHIFFTLWTSIFAHSQRKVLWKGRTWFNACWWSRWEVMHQTLQQFGDVEPFLRDTEVSPATCKKLLHIFNTPQQVALAKLEVAAVIDIGSHFVKAMYI